MIPPEVKPAVLDSNSLPDACNDKKVNLISKDKNDDAIIENMMLSTDSSLLLHLDDAYFTVPGANLKLYCDEAAIYLYYFRSERGGGFKAYLREANRPGAEHGFRGLQTVTVDIPDRPDAIGYLQRLLNVSTSDNGMQISVGYHDDAGGPVTVYNVLADEL
jgi:hypothetical protein